MFKYLSSFGASSNFQKNRLIVTARTLDAPQEYIIKKILKTFQGQDDETRAQIAYATIIKKIFTSDSNANWIYLLKNLIILDRVLQETCFVQQIAELQLPIIDNYEQTNNRYLKLKTTQILRYYWQLIKKHANILSSKKHVLYFSRSQRSQFLYTQTPYQIITQIQPIQELFQICFSLIRCISSRQKLSEDNYRIKLQLQKSGLIQYLLQQLMYKFMGYYSSEMLCVNRLIFFLIRDEAMQIVAIQHVRKFREQLIRFKNNSLGIIEFLQKYKQIKGFQVINYRDLDPMPGNNLINTIDRYITQRLNFDQNSKNIHEYISESGKNIEISVRLKQQTADQSHIKTHPRKLLPPQKSQNSINQAFSNWISSFSEDFPQKQMMTLDLIMTLKNQGEMVTNESQIINYRQRQTCVLPNTADIPQTIQFRPPTPIAINHSFKNIYSKLPSTWNFQ